MNQDFKIIEELFKKAPVEVKSFLVSENVAKKILLMAGKYGVPESKIEILVEQIGLMVLGVLNKKNLSDEIEKNFGISKDNSDKLISEINNDLTKEFSNIKGGFGEQSISNIDVKLKDDSLKNNSELKNNEGALPPSNLPTSQVNLEPMIVSKDQNPFLPPLRKISSQPQTEAPIVDKSVNQNPQDERLVKTQMTSELAAEIKNLLDKKGIQGKESQNNKASSYIPPKMPDKPEDKFSQMTQKPRVEVEMIKKENPQGKNSQPDPYREPVE